LDTKWADNVSAIRSEVHTKTYVVVTARYLLFIIDFKQNWNPSTGLVKLPVIDTIKISSSGFFLLRRDRRRDSLAYMSNLMGIYLQIVLAQETINYTFCESKLSVAGNVKDIGGKVNPITGLKTKMRSRGIVLLFL